VIIGIDAVTPAIGFTAKDAVMVVTLPPVPLRQHLLDGELRNEDEPFKVGRNEAQEFIDGVFRERLDREDAGIVDDIVDRAEPGYRSLRDVLAIPMSPSTIARSGDGAKLAFVALRDVATT
jgi:hypothetical protein